MFNRPRVISAPHCIRVLDTLGDASLTLKLQKVGDRFQVEIFDHRHTWTTNPRYADFYCVADRNLFTEALLSERLETLVGASARPATLRRGVGASGRPHGNSAALRAARRSQRELDLSYTLNLPRASENLLPEGLVPVGDFRREAAA